MDCHYPTIVPSTDDCQWKVEKLSLGDYLTSSLEVIGMRQESI
jgi:hypothetical protein